MFVVVVVVVIVVVSMTCPACLCCSTARLCVCCLCLLVVFTFLSQGPQEKRGDGRISMKGLDSAMDWRESGPSVFLYASGKAKQIEVRWLEPKWPQPHPIERKASLANPRPVPREVHSICCCRGCCSWIHIYIYIYIYISLSMCIYIYIYTYVYMHMCIMCIHIYI